MAGKIGGGPRPNIPKKNEPKPEIKKENVGDLIQNIPVVKKPKKKPTIKKFSE